MKVSSVMGKSTLRTVLMVSILPVILVLILGSTFIEKFKLYQANQYRCKYFAKHVEYCEQMPKYDNLHIFIMAGQSNMAGRAHVEPCDTIPNRRIITIDKDLNWIYAKEPLHFYEPNVAGLDCGMSFASHLLDSLPDSISIGLIPCAVGFTTVEQWQNNETVRGITLMDNFMSKLNYASNFGKIKGILWHQGESNAIDSCFETYTSRVDSLVIALKMNFCDSIPIFIGELGHYTSIKRQKKWDALNTNIHKVEKDMHDVFVVNSYGLKHNGDLVHFDSESQREMGYRYAEEYLKFIRSDHYKANHLQQ